MPFDPLNYDRTKIGARSYDDAEKRKMLAWLNTREDKKLLSDKTKKIKFLPYPTIVNVLIDLYYYLGNLFSGRRVKTSALIITSMAIGAAAGAILGTFLLPIIGSAIGGIVGGALLSVATGIGVLGLTLLGAGLGRLLSKKLTRSDKKSTTGLNFPFFRAERKYEISIRKTNEIKKHLGLTLEDAEIINAYLRNRRHAIGEKGRNSPEHNVLFGLRKLVVDKPHERKLEPVFSFFMNEFHLLQNDLAKKQDLDVVIYILKKLSEEKIPLAPDIKNTSKKLLSSPLLPLSSLSSPSHQSQRSTPLSNLWATLIAPSESFKQTKTTTHDLEDYFSDPKKAKQYDVTPSKTKDPLILNVKLSEAHQYRVWVKDDSDGCLCFFMDKKLNKDNLSSEEFKLFAEKMATAFIASVTEPNTIIDLKPASLEKQYVLYQAFEKALKNTDRFSKKTLPKIYVDPSIENKIKLSEKKIGPKAPG